MAGTTFTALADLLIRHEIDLVSQLRAAQQGLADQARTSGTQPHRSRVA